jgi:hypothetical protein
MYFPEDLTAQVYRTGAYAAHGQKDTTNVADGVNRGTVPPLAVVTQTGGGYEARLTVTVAG